MKISGRMVVIQLADGEARLLEGIVKNDRIQIISALHLKNLSGFIEAGRIVNLSGLVDHLTLAMRTASMKTNRVMLCSDNEMDARLEFETPKKVEKSLTARLKRMSSLSSGGSVELDADERIRDSHVWGLTTASGEPQAAVSYLDAERFFITALQEEFTSYGFTLIGVDAPDLAMLNLPHVAPFTYDAPDKLVIRIERTAVSCAALVRDVPVSLTKFQMHTDADLMEQLDEMCIREISMHKLSNPYVFLVGSALQPATYRQAFDHLANQSIKVYDLCEMLQGTGELCDDEDALATEGIGPAYGVCFAMLLKGLDKKPMNLIQKRKIQVVTPHRLRLWTRTTLGVASVCCAVSLALCMWAGVEAITKASAAQQGGAMRQQLETLRADKIRAVNDMKMIDTCDPFIASVMTFVNDYRIQRLAQQDFNIASVDTKSMLPQTEVSSAPQDNAGSGLLEQVLENESGEIMSDDLQASDNAAQSDEAPEDEALTAEPIAPEENQQTVLYVRGYAANSEIPINFYNALASKDLGQVRITGVEQIALSTLESVWAFEMEIKGGEYIR